MAEDTKDTAGGKGETLEKLSKRVTGLERELRLTKKYMRVVEARIGMTRPELEAVRKAGKASVAVLILAGAMALVGSIVYAGTVAAPAAGDRPYVVAPFGQLTENGYPAYVDSDGNLKLGGTITVTGGTVTKGTNVAPVISGGTATGMTNVTPVVSGGTFTGCTNASPVMSGTMAAQAATFATTVSITGVATLTAVPKTLAAPQAVGTVAALLTNAPAGMTADALWLKISYGTTNAVIPMFVIP